MRIALEIRRDQIEDVIRQTLIDTLLTQPVPDTLISSFNAPYPGLLSPPTPCIIDHFSISNIVIFEDLRTSPREVPINLPAWPSTEVETLEVPKVAIRAILNAPIISEAQLRLNGPMAPVDDTLQTTISIDMEVESVRVNGNAVDIAIAIEQIRLGIGSVFFNRETAPPGLIPLIDRVNDPELLESLNPEPLSINFGDLLELVEGFQIRNAGLKVKEGVFNLEIQIEPDTRRVIPIPILDDLERNRTRQIWQDFYTATNSRLTDTMSFGVFIPDDLFRRILEKEINDAINDPSDEIRFSSGGEPRTTWIVDPPVPEGMLCSSESRPSMQTRFDVTAVDVCVPFNIDIDASVRINVQIFITDEGALRIEFIADLDVSKWDKARCSLTNSHLLSFVGFTIGGVFGGWIGAAIGGIIAGIVGGAGTVIAINVLSELPDFSEGEEDIMPIDDRDDAYFMEIPLEFPSPEGFADLTIDTILACNNGLFIGGAASPSMYEFGLLEDAVVSAANFRWVSREYRVGEFEHRAILNFSIPKGESTVGTVIWDAQITSPALYAEDPEVFLATSIGVGGSLGIRIWMMADKALEIIAINDPEPIEITIRTNSGSRIVQVSNLNTLEVAELEEIMREDEERRERADRLWDTVGVGFEELGELLGGIPQPPPSPVPSIPPLRWWNLQMECPRQGFNVMMGQKQGDQIRELGALERDENGNFNTEVWEFPGTESSLLTMRTDPNHLEDIKKMTVLTAHFEGMSTIPVKEPVTGFTASTYKGLPVLDIQTTQGVLRYDLSLPQSPRLSPSIKSISKEYLKEKSTTPRLVQTKQRGSYKAKKCQCMICWEAPVKKMERIRDLVVMFNEQNSHFTIYQTDDTYIKRRL